MSTASLASAPDFPACPDCSGEEWTFSHVCAPCLNCSACWENWGSCPEHSVPAWHRTPVTHMISGDTLDAWLESR